MNEKFKKDLEKLYSKIGERQIELGKYYDVVEDEGNANEEMAKKIDEVLFEIDLEANRSNRLALISRLVGLRDEQLVQALSARGADEKEIQKLKRVVFFWVKNFHLQRHQKLLEWIAKEDLLNPFYRRLLLGVHEVGVELSVWQDSWNEHIINTINPKLDSLYGEEVMEFLQKHDLFEKEGENIADRAYSVLVEENESFASQAYAEFFFEEVSNVVQKLEVLIEDLAKLEDEDTNQKEAYIRYFQAIKEAFSEKDKMQLLPRWQEVDRAWMSVHSPLQVGHPLEYYEDHYRKAVALEWDVRLSNPQNLGADKTYNNILLMYKGLFEKLGVGKENVYDLTLSNLNRVQLYIGRPALYYGAEFNGLFSAQVVPNDELVSKEEGKKIFAFSDNILDSIKAKPFLKIQRVVFGEEFLHKERELVFKKPDIWHRVYEATTIGHEYGHILWLDEDTESIMNKTGVFKNIEEFKATMGGLMAFFANEDKEIQEYVFSDTLKRAVGLIGWMETDEVQPYYCEGLIHLDGLFSSGTLRFDGALHIDMSKYEELKSWYTDTYKALAKHYLAKKDAKEFLSQYAIKENGVYRPLKDEINEFVKYYWNLHKTIGRDIDEQSSKKEWISA